MGRTVLFYPRLRVGYASLESEQLLKVYVFLIDYPRKHYKFHNDFSQFLYFVLCCIMNSSEAGSSGIKLMTRRQLYDIMQQRNGENFTKKLEHLENYLLSRDSYSEDQCKDLKHKLSNIKFEFKQRWSSAHRKEDLFKKKNANWLQGTFELPVAITRSGRPRTSFEDSSERSKRRKTQSMRENIGTEQLAYATQMKLRASGKGDASKVLQEITQSPGRAKKYRKAYSESLQEKRKRLSLLKALSIFVEAGLSRKQYDIIASSDRKLFPCYSLIQRAKKDCYPLPGSYLVTATCAEVNLQDLLDHTAARLLLYLEDVVEILSENDCRSLELITKWGCDGSQQTQFKQKFENNSESDANIFQSSLVPLRMICGTEKKIIWQNPTPSSPRYCRPIRIRFVKETADITNEEIDYIQSKIISLNKTKIEGSRPMEIKHTLMFTMIDGKVCNVATNTKSTMKCYICGATSKDFNDLSKTKAINDSALQFGLSILHARIRLFESLLHLAYKLTVKKWQIRIEDDKNIVKQRKINIQEQFKNKMGLLVDVPKPGFGNTNDGNTSRRFFNNPELSAEITGVDINLIYRLKIILQVISSGYKIDTTKFAVYTMNTAKLYIQLYAWHPMTPTLHKILIHGPVVIENALLPIGQLSEEAAEARNKHFRLYRLNYARKFSREACNMDVLNRLLLSSDPLITGMRPPPIKKTKTFLPETIEMLIPEFTVSTSHDVPLSASDESSDEDEEEEDEEEEDEDEEEPSTPLSE